MLRDFSRIRTCCRLLLRDFSRIHAYCRLLLRGFSRILACYRSLFRNFLHFYLFNLRHIVLCLSVFRVFLFDFDRLQSQK
ncbi:hypothetical protein EII14_08065 [Alloprevotella sp. OH1205_COT-284]|uniref:hypothetical protein n=1 Tax=Alloprevotella sp. OH1205_COT-284 TaxID=2491043 RepID=UPI000F5F9C1D|nr:hypothetical protein [Alloprevotella sp. OH1205_COT-284]RRD76250.1 hypothetical protein EII14_08065 [Alloprevotella sp. OH1205_COT-284]